MPKPSTAGVGGQPLRDLDMLSWCRELVDAVLLYGAPAARPDPTETA